jgi:hypothetical protein
MTIPLDLPKWLYLELEKEAVKRGVGMQRLIKETLKERFDDNNHINIKKQQYIQ